MTAVTRKKTNLTRPEPGYDAVLTDVVGLGEAARHASVRTVNALITATRILAPAAAPEKVQTASGLFMGRDGMTAVAGRSPLPWSHYLRGPE